MGAHDEGGVSCCCFTGSKLVLHLRTWDSWTVQLLSPIRQGPGLLLMVVEGILKLSLFHSRCVV